MSGDLSTKGNQMIDILCLCIFLATTQQPAPVQETAVATPAPIVATAGGIRPKSNPWSNDLTGPETGSCGSIADGSGWTGALIWPVDSHEIEPGRGFRVGHGGIDIVAPLGASVYAAESGLVIWAGWSHWGGGNMVVLAHGNTRQTHYAHLNTVSVACGQFVGKGSVIGAVGQTGGSSVPHLHFVVRHGALNYDPLGRLGQ